MSTSPVRAAVSRHPGRKLHLEELHLAGPGPGEVRVRIAAAAICGSDLAYIDGEWESPRPAVFGHEAAGVIEAVGSGVAGVGIGDRVVVTLVRRCASCRHCVRGDPVACEGEFSLDRNTPLTDLSGAAVHHGLGVAGFASAVVVHGSQTVRIGAGIDLEVAALLSCGVLTGVGAVLNTARVEPGSHVVVLGCGGVGLNVVQGARLAGAATVTAFDPDRRKRAAALRLGAGRAVTSGEDPAAGVSEATGGEMADYVFVATSSVAAVETAFGLLAPMGALVLVGMPPTGSTAPLDVGNVAALNQRVLGSKMGSCRPADDIPRLADLYNRGQLELDGLVTGRYPLEGINEALDSARCGEGVRNLVVMEEDLVA
ncbi:MAG: zinc-binding dehydrogenase [bacterium]|nr:zinc-binding dehydrogenase [bacterium]